MNIVVDQQFKSLIPPLTADEFGLLELSILAEGCRDPLVVWNGVLVDGHNRHDICTRHGIPFQTVFRDFTDRDAAMDWIDVNQLGRRNLSPDAFKLLLGRRYLRVKQKHGGQVPHKQEGAKGIPQIGESLSVHRQSTEPVANPVSVVSASSRPPIAPPPKLVSTAAALGAQHGVSKNTVERAAKFAAEVEKSPRLQAAIANNVPVLQVKREIKEEKREERRQENATKIQETVATTPQSILESDAKFSTIVIDPPWDWSDEGDQDQLGRARPDYKTMTIDQLMDLKIPADDDCHLYLWTTNRSMPKAFKLLEKWGFRYITCLTWVKPSFGMGNYFRGQTEHVLFGVRGSLPLKRKDVGTVFNGPRGPAGHSSKPIGFLPLVESCSPGPFLEMFSRSERPGWVAFGENNV